MNPKTVWGYDTGRMGLWNPANLLTFARLLTGVFAVLAFEFGWLSPTWSIGLLILAALSDFDGAIARALDCASDFGRYLDPLVDKLYLGTVGIWAIFRVGELWPLQTAIIILQATIGFYVLFSKKRIKEGPSQLGKWAIGFTFAATASGLLLEHSIDARWFTALTWFYYIGAIVLVAPNTFRILRGQKL